MTDRDPPDGTSDLWHYWGDNPASAGERYELTRRKLITFFEVRRCQEAAELCDEALDRVMRNLSEGAPVTNLMGYCYGVAKNVFYEYLRKKKAEQEFSQELTYLTGDGSTDEPEAEAERSRKEHRIKCLLGCQARGCGKECTLLREYFRFDGSERIEHRRRMAERSGITRETLALRVFHAKEKLRGCIQRCLAARESEEDN